MLSYDTRKIELPEEGATKVPEGAGTAAVEAKKNRYNVRQSQGVVLPQDYLVRETSDALIRNIPDVLVDPYHITLPKERRTPVMRPDSTEPITSTKGRELVNQELTSGNTMQMTRAEYIRYVRDQCERELAYYPKPVMEPASTPTEPAAEETAEDTLALESGSETMSEEEESQTDKETTLHAEEMPLILKENLADGMVQADVNSKEAKKSRFLHLLWVRGIIAICLFMGLVSFDLLGLHIGKAGIGEIKAAVGSNRSIEKIEKIVSDFTKDTVLPVFGGDKEDGQ